MAGDASGGVVEAGGGGGGGGTGAGGGPGETGGGLLFNPHDHKDLADNLVRLMDSPELRATLAASGREAAHARFSDRHMAEATWQVLERLRTPDDRNHRLPI